jgi:hypothetical protein
MSSVVIMRNGGLASMLSEVEVESYGGESGHDESWKVDWFTSMPLTSVWVCRVPKGRHAGILSRNVALCHHG